MKNTMSLLCAVQLLIMSACAVHDSDDSSLPIDTTAAGSASAMVETCDAVIGDIILANGSTISAEHFSRSDSEDLPVAIVAGSSDDGCVLAIGIHRSETTLQWESNDVCPAFEFANNYGLDRGLSGIYETDWRLPSLDELCSVYENREAIDRSLQIICALDDGVAMNGLGTNWYWTSTQSDTEDGYAGFVHFFNGYADFCPKDFTDLHVLAVRCV